MKQLVFHGTSIIIGKGSLEYIKNMEFKKAFIITGGQSMIKSGVISMVKDMIEKANREVFIYSGITKNPDTEVVLNGLERVKEFKPDIIISIGGGSSIDAAKIITLFYEYEDINFSNVLKKKLPEYRSKVKFIAVPSTSGTGTEVTKVSVITFKEKNLKIGIKCGALIPDVAILDPNLTMTMPHNIVAETGMDALTHALECYTNNALDDFTEVMAKGAVEGLFKYLPYSYKNKDIVSREKVHNFQCMAGCAFSNVGLGMVHGISHAFGGRYNMAHGLANAIVLPYVLQYNSKDKLVAEKLRYLSKIIDREDIIEAVKELKRELHIPLSFKEAGILEENFRKDFQLLIDNSLLGSTRVNPVSVTREHMGYIISSVYEGKDVDI